MIDIKNMDCLEMLKGMEDNSVDLVVTDPPYEFHSGQGGGAFGRDKKSYHTELDNLSDGVSTEILSEIFRVLKQPNAYIWGNWKLITRILRWVEDNVPNSFTQILSWHKSNPIPTCCNKYLSDTEYCLFVRGKGVKLYGGYNDSHTYWITKLNTEDKKKWDHPTIKPEFIIEQLIKNSSQEREREC